MGYIQILGGSFQNPAAQPIADGQISFTLPQAASISGTAQICPLTVSFALDSNGNVPLSENAKIWTTDSLTPSGLTYAISVQDSTGNVVYSTNASIAGASPLNLATLTPASSSVSYPGVVLLNPASDQTISANNLLPASSNTTQSLGSVPAPWDATLLTASVKTLNNVVFADRFSGADMGAQILNAVNALPSTGGWVDARGINGTQNWSTTVSISKPCVLLLGAGTFTYTGTNQAVNASSNNVYIYGSGQASTTIKYAGASTIDLIKFQNGTAGIAYIGVYRLNTRFDAGAAASGSTQIHMVDPAIFEVDSVYMSVDGNSGAPNMVNIGLKVEVITTALVPPRGNGRIANIVHSNSNDGSAASGAIAVWLKGITGSNGGLQQIALEGHSDIESSYVGLQCEYVTGLNQSGSWYYFINNTNVLLTYCATTTFITAETSTPGSVNWDIDSNTFDTVLINPIFVSPTTIGTNNGNRTIILDNRASLWLLNTPLTLNSGNLNMVGKIASYNSITTAGNGVPSIVFQDLKTAQAANYNAGSAKTLFTPTASAMYRISVVQGITQAATSSSTLPSLTLGYTDAGGIARTISVIATSTTNTTAVITSTSFPIFTNSSTPVTVTSASYASSGVTPMQYELSITAEAL